MLPLLDPIPKGIVQALGSVAVATIGGAFFFGTLPAPSPELLRSVATIGAALLLGYIVEAIWLVGRVAEDYEYEEWLGFVVGAGAAGLIGIVASLLTAEYLAAGHNGFLGDLGLAWAVTSLAILAASLVLQPLLAQRFGDPGSP